MKEKMNNNKLTRKQLFLTFIPFFGMIGYTVYLLVKNEYYTKECIISLLKSIVTAFITGVILMLIGLFSYVVTIIISIVIIGVIMNLVFFKSYNKISNQEKV